MRITSTRRLLMAGTGVLGSAMALAACVGDRNEPRRQDRVVEPGAQTPEDDAALPPTAWARMPYDDVPQGGSITDAILTIQNGRAHVCTPVTWASRITNFAL